MRWNVDGEAPKPPVTDKGKRLPKGTKELVIEDLTLITPMLGGGVTALTPDKNLVLRGQSIRGQLRFWWRTFQPCTEVAELWEKESQLWGNTKLASRVAVHGEMITPPLQQIYTANDNNNPVPKYIAFSLDNNTKQKQFTLLHKGSFRLFVTYPESHEYDVLGSVKLWMLFGGLGARTRRGMGTLYSSKWPNWKNREQVLDFLNKLTPNPDKESRSWPSLINAKLLACQATDTSPVMSWKRLIAKYQDFRQHRVDKKNLHKRSPFGKSTWPEPDTLRELRKSKSMPNNAYFPRGAYGLPIIFQFPQEHKGKDFTLQGAHSDRYASPFIMKTIRVNDHSSMDVCLLLHSPIPKTLTVSLEKNRYVIPPTAMPLADNPQVACKPLENRKPYDALLHWMGGGAQPIILGGAR